MRPLVALLLVLAAAPAGAQAPPVSADASPAVRRALEVLRAEHERAVEEQVELCEIAAPPFGEAARAAAFRDRLAALGLSNVRIDAEGNVLAVRPGRASRPSVVLSAHLDTVFPAGTDVSVRREGTVLHGPGIGDDCRGLAVVLAVARALDAAGVRTTGPIHFVGTVGEEGRGDLRGVRHLFADELAGAIDAFLSVDGAGLDLTKDAVGSHRYRVTYRGPGGHSYGDFGEPSPIHALGRAIDAIARLEVPEEPKTTFNVGTLEGGISVNSIADEASMLVDLRSLDPEALEDLDRRFRATVQSALEAENARSGDHALEVEIASIGRRPAGTQPSDAAIVRAATEAAASLGFTPEQRAGSTDANIAIARGVPALTLDGGGEGEGAHSPSERFDTRDAWLGAKWALLVALRLAGLE